MVTVRVRVNDTIARYGGVLADSGQPEGYPRLIGAEPVVVVLTPQVSFWLATGQLVALPDAEPEPESPPQDHPVRWPKGLRADLRELLEKLGITPDKVPILGLEGLKQLPGIGEAKAKAILKAFGND